jgi:cytoskeleton protein RodZ
MPADRTGFGAKLREARERRGVSLRQIANATKISVGALEALERNDISRLPGGIFSRAFVRSYAIEVGLDPDATIHEFITQFPNDSVTAGHPTTAPVEDGVSVDNDRRMAGTFLWLVGVSVPIAAALLYFGRAGRGVEPHADREPSAVATPAPDAQPGETRPQPATSEVAPAAAGSQQPASRAAAPPASATAPATTVPAVETDQLTISLSVKRPCWVSAMVDGQKTIERLLQPGERQTIDVKREMVLTAGDASAIALSFNGVPGRPLGAEGQVVTARFTLANYKDYVQSR